ncbi:hypothetical protein RGC22_05605 [Helicobacter pylori]|uniref:hypothetical protein n=1 Tax=Helicobacter pylori TaxID=210 RepID=UPI002927C4E4|nr:hypothetical protein [Helicobacter pylori]MDU9757443.1 hypothetical protein [Helicobacter pylori]
MKFPHNPQNQISHNPLRARYEKLSLAFRKLFYFGCQNTQRYFLDFMTNIQNRADILKPYKDQ